MTFLYWKNCILLKVTSDITLSLIKEVCEQTAELLLTITNMVISGIISRWGLKKNYILWSHLLPVLSLHFSTCFQNVC